ncbi:hypothetical protein C8Q77DRAFT_1125193, partial [Trametes polyzona]
IRAFIRRRTGLSRSTTATLILLTGLVPRNRTGADRLRVDRNYGANPNSTPSTSTSRRMSSRLPLTVSPARFFSTISSVHPDFKSPPHQRSAASSLARRRIPIKLGSSCSLVEPAYLLANSNPISRILGIPDPRAT